MSFTPTDEQTAAIEAAKTRENVVVEAGAGTGKTSTVKLIAEALAPLKGLYIAFNKTVQLDAAASFPKNVKCKTSHACAFGPVGHRYRDRCFKAPRVTGRETARILGIERSYVLTPDRELSTVGQARLVMETVTNFCKSDATRITPSHVPMVPGAEEVSFELAQHIVGYAEKAWADLQHDDKSGRGKLKMNQNHYLKMWALTNPKLRFDFVIVDEAQDSNRCLMGVLLKQDCQLIAVGDRAQAIYGWNGAVDAMQTFPAQHRTTLSQSFRFGPAVADVANRFLTMLDAPLRLTGLDSIPSTVGPDPDEFDAILCRTNAGVIQAALDTPAGQTFAIVGGGEVIEKFADAAEALMSGRSAAWHADLGAFKTWADACDYADNDADGGDIRTLVNLCRDYGTEEIRRIAQSSVAEKDADRIISTAHKAKGREWNSVRIANDFTPSDERQENGISRTEQMLAYVAVTRAIQHLDHTGLDWALEAA